MEQRRTGRLEQLRDALETRGMSMREAVAWTGMDRSYAYQLARHHGLPTNLPIKRGGLREKTMVYMVASGYPPSAVGKLLGCSPEMIRQTLKAVKERVSSETGVDGTGGYTRTKAPPDPNPHHPA